MLSGRTVLVTGGGGSIGSELCRQIVKYGPKRLVIFDIYENNAYDIQQELLYQYGRELPLSVEIGSVRDSRRLELLFDTYKPDVVFHAAAHKHVPLMESNPQEAIRNNVFGTLNTVRAADAHGVKTVSYTHLDVYKRQALNIESEYDVFLDKYGYAIYTRETEYTVADYAFLRQLDTCLLYTSRCV